MDMFVAQGFDRTTVDEIAAAAGLSRSTFFRHFSTKEDVVLGSLVDGGDVVLDALRERPDGEPVWLALRHALQPIIDAYLVDVNRALRFARMFVETPSLKARHHEKTAAWQALLIPEIARRIGASDPVADPRPAALISSALGCLDAALHAWAHADGNSPFDDLLDIAMASIEPPSCTWT
jgi:AcrR family transcriptional regulator